MKKLNKLILLLVPALITFASAMVQSNACVVYHGEPEVPKSLRK